MNRIKWPSLFLISIIIIVLTLSANTIYRNPTPEEARAIEDVIYISRWDLGKAGYSFDPRYLSDAFINDHRGGEISITNLDMIRCVRNDKTISLKDVGLLDSFQALIELRRLNAEKLATIEQRMQIENRQEMTLDEKESLILCGQSPNAIYSMDPNTIPPENFLIDFISIQILGDTAKAKVTIGEITQEEILVNIDDRWFIAGEHYNLPFETSITSNPVIGSDEPAQTNPYPIIDWTPIPDYSSADLLLTQEPYPYP